MITVLQKGSYQLLETKNNIKILMLDSKKIFAWVGIENIGEILVTSHKKHLTDTILALGKYRLYKVENEPKLTDLEHLELLVGEGTWQGYLLPNGLPNNKDKRNRIIPTAQRITT